jgi:hypothetical protein
LLNLRLTQIYQLAEIDAINILMMTLLLVNVNIAVIWLIVSVEYKVIKICRNWIGLKYKPLVIVRSAKSKMAFYMYYPDSNDEKEKEKIRKYKKQISEEHKIEKEKS